MEQTLADITSLVPQGAAPLDAGNVDAAIAAVWEMAQQEQVGYQAEAAQRDALLSALPPGVRAALKFDGEELSNALGAALDDLPPEEARAVIKYLTATGIIGLRAETMADVTQFLASLPPAVRAALEAHDEEAFNAAVAQLSPEEQQQIMSAMEALFAEADSEEGEAAAIDVAELIASLPPAVRAAIEAEDVDAMHSALDQLSPEEASDIVRRLEEAEVIG